MNRKSADARIEELSSEIRRHDHSYYALDRPTIADEAYDLLFKELRELEERFPELVTSDSPSQRVAGRALESFPTVEHEAPMLSLDSDQDEAALRRFDERLRKAVGEDNELHYVLEPKLDGASLELVYEEGKLVRAATRGDGRRGEGITENIRTIPAVPLRLRKNDRPAPDLLALRGEVILPIEAFERYNEKLLSEGKEPYSNPRNSAAGALRQLDPRLTAERPLDLYVYDILKVEGGVGAPAIESQWQVLEALRAWGQKVSDLPRRVATVEEVMAYHDDLTNRRDDLPFEIDGVVVKLDELAPRAELGTTSRHPRWAFAFKFPPRREITKVQSIFPSVGRTGVVTPVAMLRPVDLAGVTVSRATLHNREEVARKDIREGDQVRIQRAGDVIPQVVERIKKKGQKRSRRWSMPEGCPSCGTTLIDRGPFAVCPNSFECPAQLAGRLTHFTSRHALDVEGFGEESARLFLETGLVKQLPDLFDLEAPALIELEGFGEKSAENLIAALARASRAELHRFVYGLGIPEVGVAVARDLADHFGTFQGIRDAGQEELEEVRGVGPRMSEQITAFFGTDANAEVLDRLLDGRVSLIEPGPRAKDEEAEEKPLAGKKLVFTGGLERWSRPEAKELVEALGARVTASVSKATDYVVAGSDPGSKLAKAEKLGVAILDQDGLAALLAEHGEEGP